MAKNHEHTNYGLPWLSNKAFSFDMLYDYYFKWALSIVFELLVFDGMPNTVNETFFKYCLYLQGKVTFFKDDNGDLLALNGNFSDVPDVYYMPTKMIITNPALNKSYTLLRDVECAVVYCTEVDKYDFVTSGGVYMLLHKTATMLADNDISINVAQKNTRLVNIISADDTNTKKSVDLIFKHMYKGEPYLAVQSNLVSSLQSVPITPSTNNSYIVQLVELHQYILSHFYEAIGLSTHDNMKKERLIVSEIEENPALEAMNIENILRTVTAGIEQVNSMFGTEITVKLNPHIQKATEQQEQQEELQDSQTETQTATAQSETQEIRKKFEDVLEFANYKSYQDYLQQQEKGTQKDMTINIEAEDDSEVSIEIETERSENSDSEDTENVE